MTVPLKNVQLGATVLLVKSLSVALHVVNISLAEENWELTAVNICTYATAKNENDLIYTVFRTFYIQIKKKSMLHN